MIFSDNPFSTCAGVSIRYRLSVFCCAKANPKFRVQCILVDASISETNGFPAYPQTPCQLPWTFLSHSPLIRNGGLKRSTPRLCLQRYLGLMGMEDVPLISNRRPLRSTTQAFFCSVYAVHHTTADTALYCPRQNIPEGPERVRGTQSHGFVDACRPSPLQTCKTASLQHPILCSSQPTPETSRW